MPRPRKCRRVVFMPEVTYFKPAGIPLRDLDEVRLSVEEAEAVRLKDLEGLEQQQCAEKMNVSRVSDGVAPVPLQGWPRMGTGNTAQRAA